MARPASSRSKITRWPWRSMRKHRALEGVGGEVVVGEVGVAHDDAVTGDRVVGLDDALHAVPLQRRGSAGTDIGPW